jgi:hypothetical protein
VEEHPGAVTKSALSGAIPETAPSGSATDSFSGEIGRFNIRVSSANRSYFFNRCTAPALPNARQK